MNNDLFHEINHSPKSKSIVSTKHFWSPLTIGETMLFTNHTHLLNPYMNHPLPPLHYLSLPALTFTRRGPLYLATNHYQITNLDLSTSTSTDRPPCPPPTLCIEKTTFYTTCAHDHTTTAHTENCPSSPRCAHLLTTKQLSAPTAPVASQTKRPRCVERGLRRSLGLRWLGLS